MKTTSADILIDTIHKWGVEVVFRLPATDQRNHRGPAKALIRSGSFKFAMKKLLHSWRQMACPE
jgi:hypothetical protein